MITKFSMHAFLIFNFWQYRNSLYYNALLHVHYLRSLLLLFCENITDQIISQPSSALAPCCRLQSKGVTFSLCGMSIESNIQGNCSIYIIKIRRHYQVSLNHQTTSSKQPILQPVIRLPAGYRNTQEENDSAYVSE